MGEDMMIFSTNLIFLTESQRERESYCKMTLKSPIKRDYHIILRSFKLTLAGNALL